MQKFQILCEEMNSSTMRFKNVSQFGNNSKFEMASHSSYIHPIQDEHHFLMRSPVVQSYPPTIEYRGVNRPEILRLRASLNRNVECWSGTTRPLQPRQPGSTPGHFAINFNDIVLTEAS